MQGNVSANLPFLIILLLDNINLRIHYWLGQKNLLKDLVTVPLLFSSKNLFLYSDFTWSVGYSSSCSSLSCIPEMVVGWLTLKSPLPPLLKRAFGQGVICPLGKAVTLNHCHFFWEVYLYNYQLSNPRGWSESLCTCKVLICLFTFTKFCTKIGKEKEKTWA